ncbi:MULTISPECIES: hypothetical protein [Spirosoma]|jgi:hypothetical protein|uniref:Type VI secretion system contractile sheath small subunit n=2 Tax=Spirosoma TaxID=107 RepID=A0A6G9AL11_9BACT|nr:MULTISPECIES: hypothetical protein [Spirosoma]QHV96081.1 hypothetical protein GJR95_14165 [Spirosoma endbachense]QIP13100.1 hypothetical protein G8759_10915 [Spirosoma aureum]
MAVNKPQIGGVIIPEETSEAIKFLQENKTAMVGKFTADSMSQAPVEGVQKLQDAFDTFQPEVDVTHETEDGEEVNETLFFQNLTAFSKQGIIDQSAFLQALQSQEDNYQSLIKRLMSNKAFQKLLADPQAKQAFIDALNVMANELDDADAN